MHTDAPAKPIYKISSPHCAVPAHCRAGAGLHITDSTWAVVVKSDRIINLNRPQTSFLLSEARNRFCHRHVLFPCQHSLKHIEHCFQNLVLVRAHGDPSFIPSHLCNSNRGGSKFDLWRWRRIRQGRTCRPRQLTDSPLPRDQTRHGST